MTKILPLFSELKPTEYLLHYKHNQRGERKMILTFFYWEDAPKWRFLRLRYDSIKNRTGVLDDVDGFANCQEGLEFWHEHWNEYHACDFVEPIPIEYLLIPLDESKYQHPVLLRNCRYDRSLTAPLLHKYKIKDGDIFSKDILPWLIVEIFGTMNQFYLNKIPEDVFDDGGSFYEFGNWGDVDGIEDFEWRTAEDAYKFWRDNRAKILATNEDYTKHDN